MGKHSKSLQRLKVLSEDAARAEDEFYRLANVTVEKLVKEKGIKNDDDNGYFFEELGDMCCMHTTFESNDCVSGSDGSEYEQDVKRLEVVDDPGSDSNVLLVTEVGEFDLVDFERSDVIDLVEYLEIYEKGK